MFHLLLAGVAVWSAIIVIMIYIALIILFIYKIIAYIFESIGLTSIAKRENYSYPFIGWIPGLSHFIIGKYSSDGDDEKSTSSGVIYALLTIIKIAFLIIVSQINIAQNSNYLLIILIYLAIYFVIDMIYMNKFYQKAYKHPIVFTFFTIVSIGLLKPIFIFASKGKK